MNEIITAWKTALFLPKLIIILTALSPLWGGWLLYQFKDEM